MILPKHRRKWIFLAIAFLLLAVIVIIPNPAGLAPEAQRALAVFVFAVVLWVTLPISYPMIFFLIAFLLVVSGVFTPDMAFTGMGTSTIFFLIGALVLAAAIQEHGLHKRIALTILRWFGSSPKTFLFGLTVIGAILSMTMPAHGVAALLIPVALGVLRASKKNLFGSNFSKSVLLTLTYGTSVGSMATLLGGARNPLAISLYHQATGESISFLDWFIAAFPLTFVMIFFVYYVLVKVYPPEKIKMEEITEYLEGEVKDMGPLTRGEKKCLFFMILAFILWIIFGNIYGIATVAVLIAALLALSSTITWSQVEHKLPWGIIFLYAGAITLAFALTETGAAQYIAERLISRSASEPILALFGIVVCTIFLSNLMSNAAATAVILPVALSILAALEFPRIMGMFLVALPSAFAFMFIIGTPASAMVYDTGQLRVKDFIKPGLLLNLIGLVVVMSLGLGWWKLLGLW